MTRLYTDDVELYDIAFSWELGDEVDWLLERLGPGCRSVLEPGSGTGRMLEALARRGVEAVGIDSSAEMADFSRRRLAAAGLDAEVIVADMVDFDLGRTFGGAVCPINTLTHLTREELALHLRRMAGHLEPGSRYLVQVGVFDEFDPTAVSEWNAERGDVALRIRWAPLSRRGGREEHHSRIEVLSGPRKGEVIEESHAMAAWTPASWRETIASSPFVEVATYEGAESCRPSVALESGGGLLWHELVVP
jgi:SAM-dependent methyltransferase